TSGSRSSGAAHANTMPPHRLANTATSRAPKRFILVTFLPNDERTCRVHVEERALGEWRIPEGRSAIASLLQSIGHGRSTFEHHSGTGGAREPHVERGVQRRERRALTALAKSSSMGSVIAQEMHASVMLWP